MREKENNILKKFKIFLNSSANTDYIFKTIEDMLNSSDFKNYDLTAFFNKVRETSI